MAHRASKPVPTPLAAALGLVPTVLGGVRRLPLKAVQLPVLAVSSALTTLDRTRRGYDDLAERGERLLASLRGTSFDEVEDRVEDALQGTPLAGPYDRVEDALEDATEKASETAGRLLRSVSGTAERATEATGDALADAAGTAKASTQASSAAPTKAVRRAAERAGSAAGSLSEDLASAADAAKQTVKETAEAGAAAVTTDVPEAERPKGEPTPSAPHEELVRHDTAASPEVQDSVDRATSRTGGPVLDHDELPLPDYDHMTLGSLRGRLRSLTVEQLVQVRDYEKAHADRLPVVTMLDNRIAKLESDPAATPSGGTPGTAPELQPSQVGQGGSKVRPDTAATAATPAPHGVPGNSSPKK